MLVFSVIFYVGSLVGIILLFIFFTEVSTIACLQDIRIHITIYLKLEFSLLPPPLSLAHLLNPSLLSFPLLPPLPVGPMQPASCSLNKFFISSVLIMSVAVSVVAILPWVQRGESLI